MSGGVDSSVAAALLLEQGYEVVGCFMRLGSPGEELDSLLPGEKACNTRNLRIGRQGCCSINDAADARLVAARLNIPFYVLNFKNDFGRVIDYFVEEYNAGRTPNPCIRCNDWLKFGKLRDYAHQIGAEHIASGHYARIKKINGRKMLCRGKDTDKDQSYVLFGIPHDHLQEMLLPIGNLKKTQVREKAKKLGLPVSDKPDSQEICFVPDNDYAALIERTSPEKVSPGSIINLTGDVVGEHPGQQHFTIGQRRGVGVAFGYPIYVVDKNAKDNTITIGRREDLAASGLTATEANWFIPPPTDWQPCHVKIRYNAVPVPAVVRSSEDSKMEVRFETPQFAVAPGQAVVCYDRESCEVVLAGAWINSAVDSCAESVNKSTAE